MTPAYLYTLGLALLASALGLTVLGASGVVSLALGLAGAAILVTREEP